MARVVHEAHVAWSGSPHLRAALEAAGFADDPFVINYPRSFDSHMTMKFTVDNRADISGVGLRIRNGAGSAQMILESAAVDQFYVEIEAYPLRNVLRGACTHLEDAPPVNVLMGDSVTLFKPVNAPKKADVHVMLCRECRVGGRGHSQARFDEWESWLAAAGFYRVVTGAQNIVWTILLSDGREALDLINRFRGLESTLHSGLHKVVFESCLSFRSSAGLACGSAFVTRKFRGSSQSRV